MLGLIAMLVAAILSIIVLFGIGAAIYELYIVDRNPLNDKDYTRTYDWTTSEH